MLASFTARHTLLTGAFWMSGGAVVSAVSLHADLPPSLPVSVGALAQETNLENIISGRGHDLYRLEDELLRYAANHSYGGEQVAVDVNTGINFAMGANPGKGKRSTVLINGEPKSGTTWLEFIVRHLLIELCTDEADCKLDSKGRVVSTKTADRMFTYSTKGKHTIPWVGHADTFDFTRPPVIWKNELWDMAQGALATETPGSRWIAIFRDPRSVAISSCYHMIKDCPEPDKYISDYLLHLSKWIDLRHRFFTAIKKLAPRRVILVYYEDMKHDELGHIGIIAEFLGLNATFAQLEHVHNTTTLAAMREAGGEVPDRGHAQSGKVREGATCGFLRELSAEGAANAARTMRSALSSELNAKWSC